MEKGQPTQSLPGNSNFHSPQPKLLTDISKPISSTKCRIGGNAPMSRDI